MDHSPQGIVIISPLISSAEKYGKSLRIYGPDRHGEIEIPSCARHSPGRHGKPADQRIVAQQAAVAGRFKTGKNVG